MQNKAIAVAKESFETFTDGKSRAARIKKNFDKNYNPTWHCVVGTNFGSYVMCEQKNFIYFYLG